MVAQIEPQGSTDRQHERHPRVPRPEWRRQDEPLRREDGRAVVPDVDALPACRAGWWAAGDERIRIARSLAWSPTHANFPQVPHQMLAALAVSAEGSHSGASSSLNSLLSSGSTSAVV